MKRIALAVAAALGLTVGSGAALAQHTGGGHMGGSYHGGGYHGGGYHGGGYYHGSHLTFAVGLPGFWGLGFGYPYYAGYPYYSYPYYSGSYYSGDPAYTDGPVYDDPAPGAYRSEEHTSELQPPC